MEKPAEAIRPLLPHVDSLMLSPGILRTDVCPSLEKGIVLRASGGNTILDPDIDDEELILTAEEAVKLGASAVAVSIFVGAEHSHQTIMNLADMVNAASAFDLPVLGSPPSAKRRGQKGKRYLSHASRLAAELGADIVKTYIARF
jgi:putative autoinducer-2 (AI-2) aldolase